MKTLNRSVADAIGVPTRPSTTLGLARLGWAHHESMCVTADPLKGGPTTLDLTMVLPTGSSVWTLPACDEITVVNLTAMPRDVGREFGGTGWIYLRLGERLIREFPALQGEIDEMTVEVPNYAASWDACLGEPRAWLFGQSNGKRRAFYDSLNLFGPARDRLFAEHAERADDLSDNGLAGEDPAWFVATPEDFCRAIVFAASVDESYK